MPRFRRPSPAVVLALLALMVALSSSAGANPIAWAAKAISGKSIARHSIPLSALSPAAVKALRGATGPRGLQGIQGVKGNAGATNVSVVGQVCGPAPCTAATVVCPAGSHATGGGGLVVGTPSNQLLYASVPASSGGLTGWEVRGGAATPPATGQLLAYAVCASP